MILAAHLPSYFPNLDFFYKVANADVLVLADDLQYPKHGVVNRGKIKTACGLDWLTVPVFTKGFGPQELRHIRINSEQNWRRKHWKTIIVNYKYAAYFEEHEEFLAGIYQRSWLWLLELNQSLIEYFVQYLGIKTEVVLSSRLQVRARKQEWIFEAMAKTGAQTYLVESGYADYLKPRYFESRGVELCFFEPRMHRYYQQFGTFLSGLSILDLILNEGANSLPIILAG
ncbi:WbqC family protein [bacterium]|nr:WbqC family protein [bacterium]